MCFPGKFGCFGSSETSILHNLVHGDVELRSNDLALVLVAELQRVQVGNQVGNQVVHDTHLLESHRGFSWCLTCGAF